MWAMWAMPVRTAACSLMACAVATWPAVAQVKREPIVDTTRLFAPMGSHLMVALPMQAQVSWGYVTPIPVRPASAGLGGESPGDEVGYLRLRLEPAMVLTGAHWPVFQAYKLAAELDIRYYLFEEPNLGLLRYDPEKNNRIAWMGNEIPQAYLLAAGQWVALKVGLMRSHWGMGLIANDGSNPEPQARASPFGFARFADRTLRLQLAFFPLQVSKAKLARGENPGPPLTVALAADLVVKDATTDLDRGDRTAHLIAAVAGEAERFAGGLYAVYRHQWHAGGGRTEVAVIDGYLRADLAKGKIHAWVEAEAAVILGSTDYPRSAFHPFERHNVLSAGGVGRFGIGVLDYASAVFEVGSASGDHNPFDAELPAFSFQREHRVGLLMFREVLKAHTAVTALNLADPAFRETPPRGFERAATGGAVSGVTYINPRVSVGPFSGVTALAGVVYGISDELYADPFWTGVAGGAPTGPRGAVGERELGFEIDLGLQYDLRVAEFFLRTRAEFAWFRPGAVFGDAAGNAAPDAFGAWLHFEVWL